MFRQHHAGQNATSSAVIATLCVVQGAQTSALPDYAASDAAFAAVRAERLAAAQLERVRIDFVINTPTMADRRRAACATLLRKARLSPWERTFLTSIARQQRVTIKQWNILDDLAARSIAGWRSVQ